jgi:hypothetical protein
VNQIPEYSVLHRTRQMSDYCKCYVLHLNKKTIDEVMDNFQSITPAWLDHLFKGASRNTALKLLLKRENEIVLGSNLKHTELRISILRDHVHNNAFHFTVLMNFSTGWRRFFYWPFRILCCFNIKTILKNLNHST